LENSVIEVLQALRKKCAESDALMLKKLGLSQAEYQFCLASLSVPGLETVGMAEKMGVSVSRMSRIVEKMVQGGLLSREHSTQDRRAIRLSFTPKGRDLVELIKKYREQCEAKMTAHLDEQSLAQLKAAMQYLIDTV